MAKLVQKSGYIKSEKAGGYMKYIATREGVEKLTGNGPVTKGQRELIQKLLHDFPDAVELFEYEDYRKTPTLGTASAFITMALDANLHEINSESLHCHPPPCGALRGPWPVQLRRRSRPRRSHVRAGSP